MKEKTRLRRFILFDEWQFEKTQSWLEAWAAKGWQVESMGRWLETFEKCEPARLRYRCDVSDRPALPAGWRLAATRQHTSVFAAEDPSVPELRSDPVEFGNSIRIKKRDLVGAIILPLLLVLMLWIGALHGGHISNYDLLNDTTLPLGLLFVVYGLQAVCFVLQQLHLLSLRAKLRGGIELAQGAQYLATRVTRGISYGLYLLLTLCVFALLILSIIADNDSYPPIPAGPLPVVRMADILGNTAFTPVSATDGLENNYYMPGWSILVPEQKVLDEQVSVKGLKAGDGSDLQPWLESDRYQALTPGLAAYLAGLIAKDSISGEGERNPVKLLRVESSGFDALWAYDSPDGADHEVVAQKGSVVFHIYYNGMQGSGEIISLIKEKMEAK